MKGWSEAQWAVYNASSARFDNCSHHHRFTCALDHLEHTGDDDLDVTFPCTTCPSFVQVPCKALTEGVRS